MADTISIADWISAISSLVAAVVAILTLLGLYLASIRIFTRRLVQRLDRSKKSLGSWQPTVVWPSALRMQRRIETSTLSVPRFISKNWKPTISLPAMFKLGRKDTDWDVEAQRTVPAQAHWVNFLECLGVSSEDGGVFYEMRYESELVNGIVPIHFFPHLLLFAIFFYFWFRSHILVALPLFSVFS